LGILCFSLSFQSIFVETKLKTHLNAELILDLRKKQLQNLCYFTRT